ncbi:MAG TPA: hypothetical protein VGN49_15180 [Micrococcaceae bacterium]|nr:hypothetical protein [Micrococcaceae bacterium]
MEDSRIEKWWPRLETRAKQWLRTHPGSADIPENIRAAIDAAGGPSSSPLLSGQDWDFIETQSEFVD